MQSYSIPVSSIIQVDIWSLSESDRKTVLNTAAKSLIPSVREGTIWFPFYKLFWPLSPDQLFENLKAINLEIQVRPYKLYSYNPIYGSYLPPKFRGQPTIIISNKLTYDKADIISDHFIEDIRLTAKRYDQ